MSPRPPGRHTIGAWLEWTPKTKARLAFRWKGKLYRITLDLSADDRAELERIRNLVGAEIRAGVFDPAKRFPSVFAPKVSVIPLAERSETVSERMPRWIEEKRRRKVLETRTAKYESHWKLYIKRHAIGGLTPSSLTRGDFEDFVGWLVTAGGEEGGALSEKTASNVVRGTLKAFLRDIDADRSLYALSKVRWERYVPGRIQDPFVAEEVAKLYRYFRERSFDEYVSIRLRFCGASPSETRGFNVGDFSRSTSTIRVQRSRSEDLKKIRPTKNESRKRWIELDAELAAHVATLCGTRGAEDPLIRKVYESSLTKAFARAQTALGINHRSIYQAKHTYATLALEAGANPAQIARNLGISLATLTKHYAAALQKGLRVTPRVGFRVVSGDRMSVRGGKKS